MLHTCSHLWGAEFQNPREAIWLDKKRHSYHLHVVRMPPKRIKMNGWRWRRLMCSNRRIRHISQFPSLIRNAEIKNFQQKFLTSKGWTKQPTMVEAKIFKNQMLVALLRHHFRKEGVRDVAELSKATIQSKAHIVRFPVSLQAIIRFCIFCFTWCT